MIYERLILMRDLMHSEGSIYVHCDWRVNSYVRLLMDEVFDVKNYRNEITWLRIASHNDHADRFGRVKEEGTNMEPIIPFWFRQRQGKM